MHKLDLIKLYSQKSALIVDEFPDMRGSIRRMLRSFGVEAIDLANDGSEAMSRCREIEYDIIICDYNLGSGKNGQQVLEELRYHNMLKHGSAYILVTAETTRSMVFGALENKPDDYLSKPFTQAVLQDRLDKIMLEKLFFAEVYEALDNANYGEAIELLADLAADNKRYRTSALQLQGQALLKHGQFLNALELYQSVSQQRPLEWASIGSARALIGLGKWSSAKKILTELIEEGSESLGVYDAIAEVEVALGRSDVAQSMLEKAARSSPNGMLRQIRLADIAANNADFDVAEKACRKVMKLSNNSCHDSSEHSLALVRCLLEKEKEQVIGSSDTLKECHSLLARAKKKYASEPEIRLQAGVIEVKANAQEGKRAQATENCQDLYRRFVDVPESSAQLGMDMAAAFMEVNDRTKAHEILEDLATRFAADAAVLSKIDAMADEPISNAAKANAAKINSDGKVLFEKDEFEKAIGHFRRAVARYPNNVAIKLNLVLALFKYASHNKDNAEMINSAEKLLESLKDLPDDHEAYRRYTSLCSEISKLNCAA